ncbi:hypothetical protein RJ639_046635 [Escallonia herrerae]|uniref:Reverse transcriptase n=1 Tax=Escallonia herrerae TaxID=1293975 RepID=A0AA88W4Z1_9ASTE|nr:hypothetical protein RJ639_046635 [Escallonia herrerae]
MQECHPVAYESRKLNEAERRYTTHEKELLAVVHCLRIWRHYLLGSSFIVRTDNTAVSHFLSQSKLTLKQARWQELFGRIQLHARVQGRLNQQRSRRPQQKSRTRLGHAGGERTLALLQQGYYRPQMGDEVQEYVKTCLTCQQDKVERKKKAGLLQPLPVPKRPWEIVSLYFITGLPKVEDLGTILVVVDRFSKYASFIATPKYCSAEDTAQLFFKYVVKYWGMPQDIVSDRDSRFTGNFWTELFKLLGSQLSMSSSYHPESDGQTERFNSMLEDSSTGKSAFEIVNGQQPLLPHTVNVPNAGKSPRAISFSEEWRQNIDLAHSYLEKAARRMKKHADKNRRSQEFNVGDKVMVKLLPQDRKFLRGRDSRLLQKYEGPLTIVKKIGKMAYKVDPPHWWSRQLHPVFHVSMLKPFYEDTSDPSRGQIKRQGLKPKAAGKRVAEAILNDRVIIASRKRHQEYLVKWQGHMDEENTWERAADLSAYADKIEAYHMQKLIRASQL